MEFIKYALTALVSGAIAFFFARKQKLDQLRLDKAVPISEKLACLLQEANTMQESLITFWQGNFAHLALRQGVDDFEKYGTMLYHAEINLVKELDKKHLEIRQEAHRARVYLNAVDLDRIEEYLKLSEFRYTYDGMGGLFFSGYWYSLWKNILDPKRVFERRRLYKGIKARFHKMHYMSDPMNSFLFFATTRLNIIRHGKITVPTTDDD